MNISIIGTGYVGLVTGACLAEVGNHVVCIDTNNEKIENLKAGKIPIYEPGLEGMIIENVKSGRLTFDTELSYAVKHGEVLFIAVGTPSDEDGSADLNHVINVARGIGNLIDNYKIIVNKSTVPVGTSKTVSDVISEEIANRDIDISFDVVSNPEFLKEGSAIEDFMKPDRIIVGSRSQKAVSIMRQLYAPFDRNHDGFMVMDEPSAELTKYAANIMLATKISLMNELANIAELVGADIERVRIGIGADPRIGYSFIYPGCGFGGSCFPKDVRALQHIAKQLGMEAPLLTAVNSVNEHQKELLATKLLNAFSGTLQSRKIAVWGLAFKPKTDDMREAPSKVLIEKINLHGGKVRAFDPQANAEARKIYFDHADVDILDDQYAVLEDADALVICTEWQSFRSPDFEKIKNQLKDPLIIDGRNLYDPDLMKSYGIQYLSIGRK